MFFEENVRSMFNRIGYRNTYGIITSNNRMVNYNRPSSNSCGINMASMLKGGT